MPQSTVYYEHPSNIPLQREESYATNPPLLDQGSQYHRSSTGYPFDSYYPAPQGANDFSQNLKESINPSVSSKSQNMVTMCQYFFFFSFNIILLFLSQVQLNPGPEFIRTTVGKVPHSASLKQKSHIPLGKNQNFPLFFKLSRIVGVIIRPLAPSDCVLPDVNFGRNGTFHFICTFI
jgi:hypothetical protein